MFPCRSCGAPLRFDIDTQSMLCAFCGSSYDPYELEEEHEAAEARVYDVTMFTCPQCGAELGSTETSAAEFCSYCGSPVVLTSRLERLSRPNYIIPFRQTKEQCSEALHRYLSRAHFLPKDFKNCEVERFRGIYMPAWSYNIRQQGEAAVKMTEETTENGTSYTCHYDLVADVHAEYHGIPHDASKAFADRISETLEPYEYRQRKPFTPAYLAGFFSDIQDAAPETYEMDALNFAADQTYREFIREADLGKGSLNPMNSEKKIEAFHTLLQKTESMLVPVWFLAYRKKDRVAYAAVNGETGKVVSDLPLSIPKLWIAALALAVPLFVLLNLAVSMTAHTSALVSLVMTSVTALLYTLELRRIAVREKNLNELRAQKTHTKDPKPKTERKKKNPVLWGCGIALAIPMVLILLALLSMVVGIVFQGAVILAAIGIPAWGLITGRKDCGLSDRLGYVLLIVMSLITGLVYLVYPVSDVPFYAASLADLLAVLFVFTNVWRNLNRLTTRPLPHFEHRGGEDYE